MSGDPSYNELAARAGVEPPMFAPGDYPMCVVVDAALYWPVDTMHALQERRPDPYPPTPRSLMSADRIRLVDAPPHCSGCFQQQPDKRHVDFEAAWDGPTLPALEGAVGVVGHHIDELILCEHCITAGAKLIGLQDVTELIKVRARLEETRDELLGKVRALEEHNEALRKTVASGQKVEQAMRPAAIMPKPNVPAGVTFADSPQRPLVVADEPTVEPVPAGVPHEAGLPSRPPSSRQDAPKTRPRAKRQAKPNAAKTQRRPSAAEKAAAAKGGRK